jgi:SAM-dependent methyltransferase
MDRIDAGLKALGVDPAALSVDDVAAVDAFHIRGREATVELAARAGLEAADRVLDVGSGLGGSARYLAVEYGCEVVGVDLTDEYVEVAEELAKRVGLDCRVSYCQGSALELPFEDASFDVVWTEHVQMNIEDKGTFYREIARVLRPGGRLMFHDIFQGDVGETGGVVYPAPWAENESISFLWAPNRVRQALEEAGLAVEDWEDKTEASATWFANVLKKVQADGPPPLGIHLLMGETAKVKLGNMSRNLSESRVAVVQAVGVKG